MAFNRTDTRQRAYSRIDSCNPAGQWIDEPTFNRQTQDKKIRVGNWQEEFELGASMGPIVDEYLKSKSVRQPFDEYKGKRVDNIPNPQSSIFLTSHSLENSASSWVSTFKGTFVGEQPAKVRVGSRKACITQEILRETEQALAATRSIVTAPSWSHYETEQMAMSAHAPKLQAVREGPVDGYLTDMPITVHHFTKNPSGTTFTTGDFPFKRNSNFSCPLSNFNKSASPQY